MVDSHKIYGYKMTEYMEEAFKKALKHHVQPVGAIEHRFEVTCRDKGRLGGRRERHTQECVLHNDECVYSCQKPKLLHRPCTHVIASCFEAAGLQPHRYISHNFLKETIWATWRHEIYGYKMVGDFIDNPGNNASYIPDPDPDMVQDVGRRKEKNAFGTTRISLKLALKFESARSATRRVTTTKTAMQRFMAQAPHVGSSSSVPTSIKG
jgi:hypothetical protein